MAVRRPPRRGIFHPGECVGGWIIEGVLGEGATGVVYEVHHRQLHTRRALKVLSWAHPTLQARLLTEGRTQATLLHPNIVSVIDMMCIGEVPALLMELVDGPSLEQWLVQHEPTVHQAELIFRGILAAVETAHAAGVIHRDLKPANVLIADPGGVPVPKVTDFGLAKAVDSDLGLTHTGMTMGTPGFMSPEQIRNPRDVDERSDIFSLGCILYRLLGGEVPHSGVDALDMMNAVAEGRVVDLLELRPDLPLRLVRATRKMLSTDPAERPADCAALRTILDGPLVELAPVQAIEPVEPPHGASWISLLLMSIVMALIGVGGVAGSVLIAATSSPQAVQPAAVDEASGLPERASIVIPEPWVFDDVDPTMLVPEPVSAEPEPAPVRLAVEEPALDGCREGFVRLPWHARAPSGGSWSVRKEAPLYAGAELGEPLCVLEGGSALQVVGEPIRTGDGRFVPVSRATPSQTP